jgi:hypothetical protein
MIIKDEPSTHILRTILIEPDSGETLDILRTQKLDNGSIEVIVATNKFDRKKKVVEEKQESSLEIRTEVVLDAKSERSKESYNESLEKSKVKIDTDTSEALYNKCKICGRPLIPSGSLGAKRVYCDLECRTIRNCAFTLVYQRIVKKRKFDKTYVVAPIEHELMIQEETKKIIERRRKQGKLLKVFPFNG